MELKQATAGTMESGDIMIQIAPCEKEGHATDKGALDCTIRARVTAAAVRATGKDVWKD